MNRTNRIILSVSIFIAVLVTAFIGVVHKSFAEDVKLHRAVPFGILNRVFPIRIGSEEGTCFVIDIDERQYIITARHIAKGAGKKINIQVFINEKWETLSALTIWPENIQTDIVALAADRLIAPRMEIAIGAGDMFAGQDVYFLGFPFGLATYFLQPKPVRYAFIKKAVLSAIDARAGSGHIFYLDGINNPGFSGGPVIFANYSHGENLQIAGVISGYRNNPIEVKSVEIPESHSKSGVKNSKRVVNYVLENTGIVMAYSISEIEKAIKTNPLGPLMPKQK